MKVLDLFSGAGGLTEGFRNFNEFNIVCHVESDRAACETLRLRNAYYYLKNHDNLNIYKQYIKGFITLQELLSYVPIDVAHNVLLKIQYCLYVSNLIIY